jgi:membrane protease subunit HflK
VDVAQAFKAVSDARVKKDHLIQEAKGYANTVIPEGRGKASSILSEANAYSAEVFDFVNGRVSAFQNLLAEYQRNPEVTAKLQYLQTMQSIYNRSRVIIDADSDDSAYYIESPAR